MSMKEKILSKLDEISKDHGFETRHECGISSYYGIVYVTRDEFDTVIYFTYSFQEPTCFELFFYHPDEKIYKMFADSNNYFKSFRIHNSDGEKIRAMLSWFNDVIEKGPDHMHKPKVNDSRDDSNKTTSLRQLLHRWYESGLRI